MHPPHPGDRRDARVLLLGLALLSLTFFLVLRSPAVTPLLRVGVHAWPGYASLYLARVMAPLEGDGVRIVEMPSATESTRGLFNDTLEAACLTLDEVLRVQEQGRCLKILAVLDTSTGGDAILGREVTGLPQLRGRRVGVEPGGVGMVFLHRALRTAGLGLGDVKICPLQAHEHERALTGGQVDAVVTFEPRVSALQLAGHHLLCDSAQVPGPVIDVLVVRADELAHNPAGVRRLLESWREATQAIHRPSGFGRAAGEMGLTESALRESYAKVRVPGVEESRQMLLGDDCEVRRELHLLVDEMLQLQLMRQPVDPHRLFLTPREIELLSW